MNNSIDSSILRVINNIPNNNTYDFDTTKSNCTSGQLNWDEENWKPIIKSDKKTTCNLYFNEIKYCSSNICDFDYTGTYQVFIAPKTGMYKLETWGAQGGEINDAIAGRGGYTAGNITLKNNDKLYFYVGGSGGITSYDSFIDGGYNGGGPSYGQYSKESQPYNPRRWGSGGGSTDIRIIKDKWNSFKSLKSRIMVSAGGGGAYYGLNNQFPTHNGGTGGGLKGYDGEGENSGRYGSGGTQTSGGDATTAGDTTWTNLGVYPDRSYNVGKFGYAVKSVLTYAAGGGSGYFAGGTSMHIQGGGGGSSYISGHNGCVAITEDSTEDNIIQRKDSNGNTCTDGTTDITCSYHYSGYIFTDTVMIDGAGYNWTTEKGDYVGQPQPDGTTATGHSGNGYARITYLGNN